MSVKLTAAQAQSLITWLGRNANVPVTLTEWSDGAVGVYRNDDSVGVTKIDRDGTVRI